MKNFTLHLLILTIVTALLGFSGLDIIGGTIIRFICLVSSVGLFISCLDAVLISRRNKKMNKQVETEKVKSDNNASPFNSKN
ncbi:hypothetical protein INR76_00600 [Marixanthomonas sp. SCSIO 43207]|uniref:hypothetical protein n=1 Tax=Marixanthomonas sp. SCSIO 43207 TaxID=2779360 RepID=UPI001CA857F9|nr:hypothetical protein [Marixanthomonas sp. SCSIO 43207]UAB81290.1 hypothetical protein INR76_00600 [Marixanthomonas sp. SCSIO 43207]